MSDERALVVQSPHLMPAMTIADATSRYQRMVGFVRGLMHEGTDFGPVPGTEKPTLLKPGAEKLCTFFGLTPTFETIKEIEDWTGSMNGGEPFFYYWFRCKLWRGPTLVAEADGSCNSKESRYRWRWVPAEDLPAGIDKKQIKARKGSSSEFSFAIDKAETGGKYGKPAEYWQAFRDAIKAGTARKVQRATKGGKSYDAYEIDTTLYRVPNEDIYSQVNTIQKIGQKRALVAVVLLGANASEFFTQDLEDLDITDYVDAPYRVIEPTPPVSEPEQPPPAPPAGMAQAGAVAQRVVEKAQAAKPDPTTNGKPKPGAAVKTTRWGAAGKALADSEPYYAKNGDPDWYHMTGAALKAGYAEINDANLQDVISALQQHANDAKALAAMEPLFPEVAD